MTKTSPVKKIMREMMKEDKEMKAMLPLKNKVMPKIRRMNRMPRIRNYK